MSIIFDNITEKDKILAVKNLIDDSTPRPSFFFLVILSVLMAACGLIINNVAIIIASMLIAPILSPILSLALGIVIADGKLISRSFFTLIKSAGWGVGLSAVTTWLLWNFTSSANFMMELNPEIIERTEPSVVYLLIALIAGAATAFARVKPDLSEALPGTAIAVALVPPLAVIGIGIATLHLNVASGAFAMFILNAIGIILSAMVMFSLMNIYTKKSLIAQSVAKADKELEKEIEKAHNHKK
jgi:uncharacterized hydrophobic protein (TIGR00271 family)